MQRHVGHGQGGELIALFNFVTKPTRSFALHSPHTKTLLLTDNREFGKNFSPGHINYFDCNKSTSASTV